MCPLRGGGGGGGGNPWEFDFVKLYLGRDFDIHYGPVGEKSGEGLGTSGPPSLKMPRSHLDEVPAFFARPFFS